MRRELLPGLQMTRLDEGRHAEAHGARAQSRLPVLPPEGHKRASLHGVRMLCPPSVTSGLRALRAEHEQCTLLRARTARRASPSVSVRMRGGAGRCGAAGAGRVMCVLFGSRSTWLPAAAAATASAVRSRNADTAAWPPCMHLPSCPSLWITSRLSGRGS